MGIRKQVDRGGVREEGLHRGRGGEVRGMGDAGEGAEGGGGSGSRPH